MAATQVKSTTTTAGKRKRTMTPKEQIEHEAKLTFAKDTLEQLVTALIDSDAFKAALLTMSRFHNYSWGNRLLIAFQCPTATQCAGYKDWEKLGRQVRKGEKGILIHKPHTRSVEVEGKGGDVEKRSKVVGMGITSTFDIAQTDPIPGMEDKQPQRLPMPALLAGAADGGLWPLFEAIATEEGITVLLQAIDKASLNGWYQRSSHEIVVKEDNPPFQRLKTLVHELAHHFAGHGKDAEESPPERETVAEGTAFVVLHTLGLDTAEYSVPYVASWAKDATLLRTMLAVITKTADTILDRLTPEEEVTDDA